MLKKIFKILRRIVVSVFLIYIYNKLALPFEVLIPMNLITVCLATFFGIPAILMLILYSILFI